MDKGRKNVSHQTVEQAIVLDNIELTLGHGVSSVHVLKGISLSLQQGQSFGIVGPSGSGKSTLLMVLAGLEKVDSGSVTIAGERLDLMNEDQAASFRGMNIGIVFQSFHLIPNMTALENVAVPLELAGRKDAFLIAENELRAVGLGERLNHYPSQLSGGEQQRVAIARALAPSPKILIADEPTGNLDTVTGQQIADLLFAKQRETGLTMVLVTHDPSLAARCDLEIPVRSGRIESEKMHKLVQAVSA
ncbi:ABC transporter ATP-binding protein [Brucellaceae bacterium C25G]